MRNSHKIISCICIALAGTMTGCSDDPAYGSDYDIQWPTPTIMAISPTETAEVSSVITITGTGLDKISSITVDNRTMTVVSADATTLKATLPRKFNASPITLINLYRQTIKSTQSISPKYPDVAITQFPAQLRKDQPFTITGTNLDLATSVIVGTSVIAVSSSNATSLNVATAGLKINVGDNVAIEVQSTYSHVTGGKSAPIEVKE